MLQASRSHTAEGAVLYIVHSLHKLWLGSSWVPGTGGTAVAKLGEPAPMSGRSVPNKNTEEWTTTVSVRNRVREDAWGRKGEALSSEMRGRGSHTKTWGGWCSGSNSGAPRQEVGGAGQTARGFSHRKECGFFLLCATQGLKHGNDRS